MFLISETFHRYLVDWASLFDPEKVKNFFRPSGLISNNSHNWCWFVTSTAGSLRISPMKGPSLLGYSRWVLKNDIYLALVNKSHPDSLPKIVRPAIRHFFNGIKSSKNLRLFDARKSIVLHAATLVRAVGPLPHNVLCSHRINDFWHCPNKAMKLAKIYNFCQFLWKTNFPRCHFYR